jgi:uncharacterized membrane protein YdjX (TVP38/TMEM64 family)
LLLGAALIVLVWLVVTDAPVVRFLVRLYRDKHFMRDSVAAWGWLAPLVFIGLQALQVIVSPFPGEITGPVGGALFGTMWGLVYSTVGLTIGTLTCFGLGRFWGEPLIRPWLSEHNWSRMNFIVEAEGAILCFILYLIPGFPKDIISYLFGISPMPFWLFAVYRRWRLPGTISSYFGTSVSSRPSPRCFIALVTAVCALLLSRADVRRFHKGRHPTAPSGRPHGTGRPRRGPRPSRGESADPARDPRCAPRSWTGLPGFTTFTSSPESATGSDLTPSGAAGRSRGADLALRAGPRPFVSKPRGGGKASHDHRLEIGASGPTWPTSSAASAPCGLPPHTIQASSGVIGAIGDDRGRSGCAR